MILRYYSRSINIWVKNNFWLSCRLFICLSWKFTAFFALTFWKVRKRKIRHVWQRYAFRRNWLPCGLDFWLACSFTNSHYATGFQCFLTEALANRRYLRGVFGLVRYRGVMSGSESVPPKETWNPCILFRQCYGARVYQGQARQSFSQKPGCLATCLISSCFRPEFISHSKKRENCQRQATY